MLPSVTTVADLLLPQGAPLVRSRLQRLLAAVAPDGISRDGTPGDPGLLGPDSVTWKVIAEPAMVVAGLRAALLQTLSPQVVAGVHNHGSFAKDFFGRVQRTAMFIEAQCLGSMDEVIAANRRVRAAHRVVNGVTPSGMRYDANDTHQQAWVSITLTDSIIVAYEQVAGGRLTQDERNRLIAEQAVHAALLDPRVDVRAIARDPAARAAVQAGTHPLPMIEEGELPLTHRELVEARARWAEELEVRALQRTQLALVTDPPLPGPQRLAVRTLVRGTCATIPEPFRTMILPTREPAVEAAALAALRLGLASFRLLHGPNRSVAVARRRAAAPA